MKWGLSTHLCLLNSGWEEEREAKEGREGRQLCEETAKEKQEKVDTSLNTGSGWSTGHHASLVLSVGWFLSTSHTWELCLELSLTHLQCRVWKSMCVMSVPVHFYMCFTCRLCLYFFTFVRLHIESACVSLRLYVRRTCAGFLMSLFVVQSNDVFSWGIGSEKVILWDRVCCRFFVLHTNAALTPTKVSQSMTLRGCSREC